MCLGGQGTGSRDVAGGHPLELFPAVVRPFAKRVHSHTEGLRLRGLWFEVRGLGKQAQGLNSRVS